MLIAPISDLKLSAPVLLLRPRLCPEQIYVICLPKRPKLIKIKYMTARSKKKTTTPNKLNNKKGTHLPLRDDVSKAAAVNKNKTLQIKEKPTKTDQPINLSKSPSGDAANRQKRTRGEAPTNGQSLKAGKSSPRNAADCPKSVKQSLSQKSNDDALAHQDSSALHQKTILEEIAIEEQIIAFGRKKGFLLYSDVFSLMPEAETNQEAFDYIMEVLMDAGVSVFKDKEEAEKVGEVGDGENLFYDEVEGLDNKHGELFLKEDKREDVVEIEDDEEEDEGEDEGEDEEWFEDYASQVDISDIHSIFLSSISKHRLLTHPEEIDLAQRIERGRDAKLKITHGDYASEKERRLLMILSEDGSNAFNDLIKHNIRLVISVAKKYAGQSLELDDLIQEGIVGLIKAIRKFDWRRGHKFSTYATWWVRQTITRAIIEQGRTIRIPVHMNDKIVKLIRVKHHLTQELGRTPTPQDIAENLNISVGKVEKMMECMRPMISIDAPINHDDDETEFGDFVADRDSPSPLEHTISSDLRERLSKMVAALPPKELRVLSLRYGLLDGIPHTLDAVGKKLGISRERVRQIESQALNRLRNPKNTRILRDYLT